MRLSKLLIPLIFTMLAFKHRSNTRRKGNVRQGSKEANLDDATASKVSQCIQTRQMVRTICKMKLIDETEQINLQLNTYKQQNDYESVRVTTNADYTNHLGRGTQPVTATTKTDWSKSGGKTQVKPMPKRNVNIKSVRGHKNRIHKSRHQFRHKSSNLSTKQVTQKPLGKEVPTLKTRRQDKTRTSKHGKRNAMPVLTMNLLNIIPRDKGKKTMSYMNALKRSVVLSMKNQARKSRAEGNKTTNNMLAKTGRSTQKPVTSINASPASKRIKASKAEGKKRTNVALDITKQATQNPTPVSTRIKAHTSKAQDKKQSNGVLDLNKQATQNPTPVSTRTKAHTFKVQDKKQSNGVLDLNKQATQNPTPVSTGTKANTVYLKLTARK